MEDYALSMNLNIEQKEAKKLVEGYLNAFPKLKAWMEWSDGIALDNLEMSTESGRIRHFPQLEKLQKEWSINLLMNSLDLWHAYHEDEIKYKAAKKARGQLKNALNNAKNFQIQGLSASIMNRAAIKLNRALKPYGALIVLQIHDQLVIESIEKNAIKVQELTQNIMESIGIDLKLSVKLKAPAQIGTNLADAH